MYQVHENVRDDKENTADKTMIANHGNPANAAMKTDHGDPAAGCTAQHIHCSVSADALSYTVEVPSTGHRRTFKTRVK
jgi:hypothetical protein